MVDNPQSDMKSKKDVGTNKKVLDISRPKKRPATGAPSAPLVIPKRTVMVSVSEPAEDTSMDLEPTPTKRVAKSIEPTSAPTLDEPVITQPAETPPAPAGTDTPATPDTPQAAAAQPEPEEPQEEPAADTTTAETAAVVSAGEPEPDVTNPKSATDKNNPTVKKALEDAKREQEIQGYIDKHEFFVPINSVARKRSIKVTLILVFVEIILGLFLLNLMLDAGLIYLLEKVPHTHFFNLQ